MLWICREKCFWRDKLWAPGESIDVSSDLPWVYSGGAWVPDGIDVADPMKGQYITRCFEPSDFSCLKDVRDVLRARNRIDVHRTWKLPSEIRVDQLPIEEQPIPEPLVPKPITDETPLEKVKVAPSTPRFKKNPATDKSGKDSEHVREHYKKS